MERLPITSTRNLQILTLIGAVSLTACTHDQGLRPLPGFSVDTSQPPHFRARGNDGLQIITQCLPDSSDSTRHQIQKTVGSDISTVTFDGDIEACITEARRIAKELCESLPDGCDSVRKVYPPREACLRCHTPEGGCSNQCHSGDNK